MPDFTPSLASLLTGGGQSAEYGNPALADVLPRLRLAQAMMQSGIDASPVQHPLQALARVAQAGAGGLMQRGAVSELARAYSGQAAGLADAFKGVPGSEALVAALRNPATAPIALQTAGKALTSLPEQAFERQKFYMQYNKPELQTTSVDPMTGQRSFIWATPANKGISPANVPLGSGGAGDPIADARMAIAKGADRNAVIQRLRDAGIDPSGL